MYTFLQLMGGWVIEIINLLTLFFYINSWRDNYSRFKNSIDQVIVAALNQANTYKRKRKVNKKHKRGSFSTRK